MRPTTQKLTIVWPNRDCVCGVRRTRAVFKKKTLKGESPTGPHVDNARVPLQRSDVNTVLYRDRCGIPPTARVQNNSSCVYRAFDEQIRHGPDGKTVRKRSKTLGFSTDTGPFRVENSFSTSRNTAPRSRVVFVIDSFCPNRTETRSISVDGPTCGVPVSVSV